MLYIYLINTKEKKMRDGRLNMKYCRTENVIAALREWEDDHGTDEHLHNELYALCLRIAADAGLVPDMTANA